MCPAFSVCIPVPAGGIATHDAVVWGPTKEEQQRRKAAKDPLLKVRVNLYMKHV